MTFAFHAAAPPGEWLNDPNGLAFVDSRYVLYAQHSVAGPAGHDVGWGRLTSDDMLAWTWGGVAIPPSAAGSAFSGCLVHGQDGIEAFYTRHDPDRRLQTQHRALAPDFDAESAPLGPQSANCRDPFVFWCAASGDWRILIALPCGWSTAASDPPSRLGVWRSPDRAAWEPVGEIGPWHPAGVMWEVPVLITVDGIDVLILSLIDRRDDAIDCSVRYWLGAFDGAAFSVADGFPRDGVRLDHGPDFYAAIGNLAAGWPDERPVIVGWASNWRAARTRAWPGGARGGPISLPRHVTVRDGRLHQAPVPAALALPHRSGSFAERLSHGALTVDADRATGRLRIQAPGFEHMSDATWLAETSSFRLFEDNGLIELFIEPEGLVVTVALV
ncbi:MAG: glycoside hydrolase family 32 protein [Sphingomonadaceae bacterium]